MRIEILEIPVFNTEELKITQDELSLIRNMLSL